MKSPSRSGRSDSVACPTITSLLAAVFSALVVLQIVSNTDQAAVATVGVVRVVRVDVPPVVRSYDGKSDAGEPAPLLLGCTYALEGGENDDENGDTVTTTTTAATGTGTTDAATTTATATAGDAGRGERSARDAAADAAAEELQHQRGLVVKWYFRRAPAAQPADPAAVIDDSVQVYQWLAGGGPEAGGGLGPLSGRVVDVSAETPRANKSLLHRVIRVERPTAELTGEYRCQVEDWHAERRSAWHPMVVYTPERVFKISVDDNDDDDEHDIAEGSGGEANSTTQAPYTTSDGAVQKHPARSKQPWPTEINITCYAAGVHPEPSMSVWVNGVEQDNVTVTVTDDDGDDDESNDGDDDDDDGYATSTAAEFTTTTTTTTTTVRPKVRGRFRGGSRAAEDVVYKNYAVRASKVVSLKEVEERRAGPYKQPRRRNTVEVECRLRVPGDGRRPADRCYNARRSVAYKYSGDSSDAHAALSSASSMDDEAGGDDAAARESTNGADAVASVPGGALLVVLRSAAVAGLAVLAARRQ